MTRGQHDAEIRVECPGEVRDARRRDHAEAEHVNARACQPGDDGRLEEITGSP
jgi:hypothetical protein